MFFSYNIYLTSKTPYILKAIYRGYTYNIYIYIKLNVFVDPWRGPFWSMPFFCEDSLRIPGTSPTPMVQAIALIGVPSGLMVEGPYKWHSKPIGSMGRTVYLATWMNDFYSKCGYKYTSPMDPMGIFHLEISGVISPPSEISKSGSTIRTNRLPWEKSGLKIDVGSVQVPWWWFGFLLFF